ncbi:hypothetical protein D3C78_1932850 [compost metagenome]
MPFAIKKATRGPRDSVANADIEATIMITTRNTTGIPFPHRAILIVIRDIRALIIGLLPGRANLPGYSSEYSPNIKWINE